MANASVPAGAGTRPDSTELRSVRVAAADQVQLPAARHSPVEQAPRTFSAMPGAAGGRLGILGGASLEEVGVLYTVEDLREPGQRMLLDAVDLWQAQLLQPPVGDVAD